MSANDDDENDEQPTQLVEKAKTGTQKEQAAALKRLDDDGANERKSTNVDASKMGGVRRCVSVA